MKQAPKNYSLWLLSWPLFFEQLAGALALFVDSYFLSRISDEVAGAIGVIAPVILLGSFIIPIFTSASTSIASQYIGANKIDWFAPG